MIRHYLLDEKGFSSGTITIYVSLFKKMCRIAFERGLCKNLLFAHYLLDEKGFSSGTITIYAAHLLEERHIDGDGS